MNFETCFDTSGFPENDHSLQEKYQDSKRMTISARKTSKFPENDDSRRRNIRFPRE